MDYSNGDLTLQRYYEPIKLSFVTNPHDPALGDAIWGNLSELDTLTHTAAPGAISHIDAFKKFLATANTNNNIGNAFAYGDRHTPGDNALSRRLSEIDRTIQHNAAKHGRLFPHLQTIADLWNEFKTGIPEKTVLIAQNYRDVVAKLEEQGCLATTETAKAGWDERLARTRANFTAYQSQLHAVPATKLANLGPPRRTIPLLAGRGLRQSAQRRLWSPARNARTNTRKQPLIRVLTKPFAFWPVRSILYGRNKNRGGNVGSQRKRHTKNQRA